MLFYKSPLKYAYRGKQSGCKRTCRWSRENLIWSARAQSFFSPFSSLPFSLLPFIFQETPPGYNNNSKKRSHTQLDSRKQVIAFQDRVIHYKHKGSSTPTKMRKTSNRQIQYNVDNFDKIHASSASVRNWASQ